MNRYIKNKQDYTLNDFKKEFQYLKYLRNKNMRKISDSVYAAINAATIRVGKINFSNPYPQINDSLISYTKYVIDMIKFINANAVNKYKTNSVPFQIDLIIIPNKLDDSKEEPESPDADDNDDVDPDFDNLYENSNNNIDRSTLGNLDNIFKNAGVSTFVYKTQLRNDKPYINQYIDALNILKKRIDIQYISKQRFVFIIDRRGNAGNSDGNNDDNKDNNGNDDINGDILYVYKPGFVKGTDVSKIPTNIGLFPEKFLALSHQSVLPGLNDTYKKPINCRELPGSILCLIFGIESDNEISCWLYKSAQSMRFMPTDLGSIWPKLFLKDTKLNDDLIDIIKELKLRNDMFDSFFQNNTGTDYTGNIVTSLNNSDDKLPFTLDNLIKCVTTFCGNNIGIKFKEYLIEEDYDENTLIKSWNDCTDLDDCEFLEDELLGNDQERGKLFQFLTTKLIKD